MALLTKVGSFAKLAGAGTQAITGLGFTPKAIIFWHSGSDQASGTWDVHLFSGLGFTAGPTNSFAVSSSSQDAVATSNTGRRMAAKAITQSDWNSAAHEADLTSFDADGFTLTWGTDGSGIGAMHINYLALGGSDITGAKVVNWTTPTATGNKAVTGVGFSPDLVLHSLVNDLGALGSAVQAYLAFGAMNKHGQQVANSFASEHGRSPSNTARGQQTDACIYQTNTDAASPTYQAHYVSMDADGFTTNFSNVTTVAHQAISLCLKGVSSKIGAFAKTTAAAPAAQSITRTGFTPKAVMASSVDRAAEGAPVASAFWTLGASDGVNERVAALQDLDANNPTAADSVFASDKVYVDALGLATASTQHAADLTSMDSDGFSLSWTTNTSYPTEILYLALGEAGSNTFPSKVYNTDQSDATAFSNQRRLDRFQNGNMIAAVRYNYGAPGNAFMLSTNGGVTWASTGMEVLGASNGSLFIDLDDYLHFVWKQSGTGGSRTDGYIYYMRGTPNAERTSWTWSAAQLIHGGVQCNYPDVVVHREGTGWMAHVVSSYYDSGGTNLYATYNRVEITGAGAFTVSAGGLTALVGGAGALSGNYGVAGNTWPSIDFNHTGDGKTVAGSTPHLYAAWSAGKTGAGFGIRFRKATYAAGAWTWGTEVEIDNRYFVSSAAFFINCLYDGTRVILPGILSDGTSNEWMVLHDRDAADTTTTIRLLTNPNQFPDGIHSGSTSYDASGNVYLLGRGEGGSASYLNLYKWTRATAALTLTQIEPTGGTGDPYVSMKRGVSSGRIEWVYTSGNNSPYAVKYDRLVLPAGGGPRMMV